MEINSIKDEDSYRAALAEIETLMMAAPGTPEGEKLDVLVTLVEAWESKHYPMDVPDPVAAITFNMERAGLTPKDLQPMIGSRSRVHEILNKKRPLTLQMIRNLNSQLGIPAECLIAKYDIKSANI